MDTIDRNERLLAMPPLDVDSDAALSRFSARADAARHAPGIAPFRVARPARWLAAAAAAVVVAMTLTLTGVADSIFQIFEAKQFAAITVTPTDLQTLEQLSAFGTLTWSSQPQRRAVPTLVDAVAETGLPAITVSVPPSITAAARYGILPKTTGTFVFDANKVRTSAGAIGRTAPPMPAALDGSTLMVSGGPALAITYGSDASGSTLIVGVAKAPTVSSDGASVAELQAYLLAQPGVSPELAAQLRAIADPASTLPIPIPIGQASATPVNVHGTTGLFIGDSTGLGSGVLWQQGGLVYVVGGTLTEAQVIAVANSLR